VTRGPAAMTMSAADASQQADYEALARRAIPLWKSHDAVRRAVEAARSGDDDCLAGILGGEAFRDALARSGMIALLRQTVVADLEVEFLLTAVRRLLLTRVAGGEETGDLSLLLGADWEHVSAALAIQNFNNEFVFWETDAEAARVQKLHALLREQLGRPATTCHADARLIGAVIGYAMYRPLHLLGRDESLIRLAQSRPHCPLAELILRQVVEPRVERDLRDRLRTFGEIKDPVSKAVRAQYEQHPYPRWITMPAGEGETLAAELARKFPHLDGARAWEDPARVLVAGCGTGRHAIRVARRYPRAAILAVDLSAAALAYGQRKASEAGVTNLSFLQADVLALRDIGQRFDLIEVIGVLHHLRDPLEGGRVLTGLLTAWGLMKVGLYSETGRSGLRPAQDFFRSLRVPRTPQGIRAARRALSGLPLSDPARRVTRLEDFYTVSSCVDLLCHARECAMTLPQLGEALRKLELEFVGFDSLADDAAAAYRRAYPDDEAMTDLTNWSCFEQSRPETFLAMYRFWCRRARGAA
jgi:SAM-dependent methyltransferase